MMLLPIIKYSKIVNIPVEDLLGDSRKEKIMIAKEIYWYYLYFNGNGYRKIAYKVDRSVSTIQNGVNTVRNLIYTDHELIRQYKEFLDEFCPEIKK